MPRINIEEEAQEAVQHDIAGRRQDSEPSETAQEKMMDTLKRNQEIEYDLFKGIEAKYPQPMP